MTKKQFRLRIVLIVILVLAGTGWFIFMNLSKTEETKPLPLKILPDKVDIQAEDILYTEIGGGNVKYEIRAKTVYYIKENDMAEFKEIGVTITTPSGNIYTIVSDQGTYDMTKKDITLQGNVVVESEAKDRITTDYLLYTAADNKIHTDSLVTVVYRNIELKGTGLTFWLEERRLSLLQRVEAKIKQK
ncbi:MAG: LPS export ABC transporter periplasmic protein LptC [Syntrophobacterales bacterium]|jgi:LPS export ABC transporter protein LptC|nr:LPS export ABC transporter periplasmic protein LptC [Syntrophobacterales bacterium]